MTTIIGVQKKDRAVIGADSLMSGGERNYEGTLKIIERNGYVYAGAGDPRPLQLALYTWRPPQISARTKDLMKFMVNSVAPSLGQLWEKGKIDFKTGEEDDRPTIDLIIALRGEIFEIDQTLTVTRDTNGLYAAGSGGDYALAALHAGATPRKAMEIAEKMNNKTGRPFKFITQFKEVE